MGREIAISGPTYIDVYLAWKQRFCLLKVSDQRVCIHNSFRDPSDGVRVRIWVRARRNVGCVSSVWGGREAGRQRGKVK